MDPFSLDTEDWYVVWDGARAAVSLVTASNLAGPVGLSAEPAAAETLSSFGQELANALQNETWQTPFMRAFSAEMIEAAGERQETFQKIAGERRSRMLAQGPTREYIREMHAGAVRDAVALVEAKAGAEAVAEYRRVVFALAVKAVQAAHSGYGQVFVLDGIRKLLGMQ